eukprot:Selendium_serpulae@DN5695_c0_g1_i2.p1
MRLQHRAPQQPARRESFKRHYTHHVHAAPFHSIWSRRGPIGTDRKLFLTFQTFAALCVILFFVGNTQPQARVRLFAYDVETVQVIPHVHNPPRELRDLVQDNKDPEQDDLAKDKNPFTQGLLLVSVPGRNSDGTIAQHSFGVESTGLYGSSIVRIFSLKTGETHEYIRLPDHIFGEGITMLDEATVLVLSWREKTAYAIEFGYLKNIVAGMPLEFPSPGAKIVATFKFDFEGWGLTSWHRKLWATTGGDTLLEFDVTRGMLNGARRRLSPSRLIPMKCFDRPLKYVNELEYNPSTNTIFGNVFGTQVIVELNVETGECESVMSIAGLYDPKNNTDKVHTDLSNDVANGVAFDEFVLGKDGMLITGKRWPWFYIIDRKPVFINNFPTSWNDVARRMRLV